MRKVFLDDLPKKEGIGSLKGQRVIDWKESVGKSVSFIYKEVKGEVEIVDCNGRCLYIKYEDKEIFKISTGNFQNCQLGTLLGKRTNEFKVEIGTHFKDEKRDLVILNREYRKDKNGKNYKYYKYKCNKCGWDEGWIAEDKIEKKIGCSVCCPNPRTVVEGINDIPTTAPWMVKYFQGGYDEAKLYTKSSHQKVEVICPDCGKIKDVAIYHLYKCKSIGCSCGDKFSYGHKYIHNLLTQLNQEFTDNHKFSWCKFYNTYKNKDTCGEYDFVIEDMKLIIEVDGGWHRIDNNMSGQSKEESQFLDNMKDRLAKKYGYKIIRLHYEDNKLNIVNSVLKTELNNLFNLSIIDWNKCEIFALSNRVKEACELKRDNSDITTTEIGKAMKLCGNTICTYLKKGAKLGWCNYDPKKEKSSVSVKAGKENGKPVEIFKNGQSLGVFPSCNELARQSEELFGIKLFQSMISEVCNDKQKHHKGFTFKYTTQEEYQKYLLKKELSEIKSIHKEVNKVA